MSEKNFIILGDEKVEYEIRKSNRAKFLRITVFSGGEVATTLPHGVSLEKMEDFIRQKTDWVLQKINLAKRRKPVLKLPKAGRKEYLKYREQARKLAKAKLDEFSRYYGLQYERISIRNQKSRWGSCSGKGNLNFNYRIVHLPEKYLDYIIVHELCHIREFNHSRKFWNLVSLAIPDYRKIRREVRSL